MRSWVVDLVGSNAFADLAENLSGSELQSLLMEVFRQRAGARTPADVLAHYRRDPFCQPGAIDQRTSLAIDAELLAAAERFEAIELSLVAPLGACSVIAATDQNRVLSALRTTEVMADPTNVLALECAVRLRGEPNKVVHLATCQRVVRAQALPKVPGFTQHFRIFVLASGGLEASEHGFSVDALVGQVETMLLALDRLERAGYRLGSRRIEVLTTRERAALGDRIAERLGAVVTRGLLEHPYYSGGLRYRLWVKAPDGADLPLADGGTFDWLSKLMANRRAVYVASGIGSQLIPQRFAREAKDLGSKGASR